jgi:Tol biopolymer transport system component
MNSNVEQISRISKTKERLSTVRWRGGRPCGFLRHILIVLLAFILVSCTGAGQAPEAASTPGAMSFLPAITVTAPPDSVPLSPAETGKVPFNLTNGTLDGVVSPSWSPDGQQIVFVAGDPTQGNNRNLYLINRDMVGLLKLTNSDGNSILPQWSPDGQQILFTYQFPDGQNAEIFVVSASGADLQQLTKNSAYDWDAIWSPIGNKIAFISNRDGSDNLYVMDPDGSNQLQLTSLPTNVGEPDWSPEGTSLIFSSSTLDGTASDLYSVGLGGFEPVQLTSGPGYKGGPQYSPDGKKILYSTESAIFVMNADGSNGTQIAGNVSGNFAAVWSPDGTMIAFQSDQSGDNDIFVVNADGTGLRYLPRPGLDDLSPVWSPDGKQLLFISHTPNDPRSDLFLVNIDAFTPSQ